MKFILTPISNALNKVLHLDPHSQDRLQKLNGKVVSIELLPLHFKFNCRFTEDGITIEDKDVAVDTQIIGTPLQMLGVMFNKSNRQKFFSEDVKIIGDAEIGQQVIELFDELEIDWEEKASHYIGDVPTQHLSQFIKNAKNWLQETEKNLTKNMTDYIQEEKQWLPMREALDDFFNDIDILRMDVDRLEARIKKLKESEDSK